MSRWQRTLWSDHDRELVKAWIDKAPKGFRVKLQETKRTVPQNDRMWAMLTAISVQLVWRGQRYTPDQWKDYFIHALRGGAFMPDEDGGMVPIGRSSSRLAKQEFSLLMEIIEGFCERNGVDLSEQGRSAA